MGLLNIALGEYGVREIRGAKHNPRILEYFKEIGHEWVKDDETAWCSAFINWCALKAGVERSGKLNARSWMDIGKEVSKPKIGDLVIFWRESPASWKGHVAIYINSTEKAVFVLGGNQNNSVNIQSYGTGS